MMNFLRNLASAKTAPKAEKPAEGSSCGSDQHAAMETKKDDTKKGGDGCCGGHCH